MRTDSIFGNTTIETRDPGVDPAVPVPADGYKEPPYVATGYIRVGGSDQSIGTCWLAGSNTAVTAAHVVYPHSSLNVVLPGINGDIIKVVEKPILHPQYQPGKYDWDIALLRLPKAARGFLNLTGAFSETVQVLGFPGPQTAMFTSSGPAVQPEGYKNFILHKAYTNPGHSGGPVLKPASGTGQQVIALHVAGFEGNPDKPHHPMHNTAVLLREQLESFIREYLAKWG